MSKTQLGSTPHTPGPLRAIALPALLLAVGASLLVAVRAVIEGGVQPALYLAVLTFGNVLLPTIALVGLYRVVRRRFVVGDSVGARVTEVVGLVTSTLVALVAWSAVDVLLYEQSFARVTLDAVRADFAREFAGFLPVALVIAALVPIACRVVDARSPSARVQH